MPFVLIGGHAVNSYGISRQTGDIDLLVQLSKKEKWFQLLEKLKYKSKQNDDKFARFQPDSVAAWPIDLMLVDDTTFEKMLDDSRSTEIGSTTVQVASPRHLVALKIHALKYFQQHRYAKDYSDLIQLLRQECKEISRQELKELCERYAHLELFNKIEKDLSWTPL